MARVIVRRGAGIYMYSDVEQNEIFESKAEKYIDECHRSNSFLNSFRNLSFARSFNISCKNYLVNGLAIRSNYFCFYSRMTLIFGIYLELV